MYLTNSEIKQLDLLKKKSPQERFLLMVQLIESQIEAMRAGIRYRNPKLDEKGVNKCLRERIAKIYSLKH